MDGSERQLVMLAMATASFLVACVPAVLYLREKYTLRTWTRGSARIQVTFVEKSQTTSGASTESAKARYIFRTSHGDLIEGIGRVNGRPDVGSEVEVRYRLENPEKNSIYVTPRTTWLVLGIPWTIVFVAFAGVCVSDAFWSTMSN